MSILNTDYKILTKVLANRLKIALPELINADQIGYMSGRSCFENIRLISDMIEFCKIKKHPCIILLVDFEKAFDSINWTFLKHVLQKYGFGKNFQKWIATLYSEIESCVSNNGHMSSFFKLSKGVRQGCPISALLFLLVVEVVAIILRHSEELTGIIVGQTEIRLCMFADDMTMFLYNLESVKVVMEIFEEFYRYAGLKLNKKKTEALALQSIDCTPNNLFGIKWIDCPFKTLGFWFSINYDEMFQLNTNEKMKTMQNTINSWSSRCLTKAK